MIETYIDHTLLRADAMAGDFVKLAQQALQYKFRAVCVAPGWLDLIQKTLGSARVGIAAVVGFPLGNTGEYLKVQESLFCIENGATEIDMVLNIGALKAKEYDKVCKEIQSVKSAIGNLVLKVILETALLERTEIITGSKIILDAGADFIKTSTGFSHRGASIEDILTIQSAIGDKIAIKASGGIRTYIEAKQFIELGVKCIGSSNGVKILQEEQGL